MRSVEYLADGHHVDDAGNLIACTYVDFRDPAERFPVAFLQKASSKRHAVPGCETIRISKPSCFPGEGDLAGAGDAVPAGGAAWVYCAFIEPETPEEQAAWRAAMPAGRNAVSPIRRPREFARALGAMVAEQVGPQGRTVLLRSAVDRHAFRTAHRGQTVYHGPVAYAEDPDGRLESASSVLELALLRVFLKPAAHRGQREYRFAVWAHGEPGRDRVDLEVSAALLDAMQRPPRETECGVVVPAGADQPSAVEEVDHPSSSGVRVVVEAPLAIRHPTIAPPRYGAEDLPADLRETAALHAAVEALRVAVDQVDGEPGRDTAAAAWHAASVVRFFCSTYGGSIAGVRVNEEGFIVLTTDVSGEEPVEATIAVGPDGTCACKVSTANRHVATASPDTRSFEQVLADRLADVGVRGKGGAG
ncbi:MAG: hypothetical protein OXF93_15325 [Acidobacteria bacterium]|nr:hypothetical protein [Acidobacteriota bacterium]